MIGQSIEQKLQNDLMMAYPTARVGFIRILIKALSIHAKKNNDYNGKHVLFPPSVNSLYQDIKRKMGRLYNIMDGKTEVMVDEKLEDTVLDLGNYAFLLAEEMQKEIIKEVHMGQEMDEHL